MFLIAAGALLGQLLQPIKYDQPAVYDVIHSLAGCESQYRPRIKILDSNNAYSYGWLQFQEKTFITQIGRFKMLPAAEPQERMNYIYDKDVQIELAVRMLNEDWNAWTNWKNCWTKLGLPVHNPDRPNA